MLNKNGFLILQLLEVRNNGRDTLTTMLLISTGLLKPTTMKSEHHIKEELDLLNNNGLLILQLPEVKNNGKDIPTTMLLTSTGLPKPTTMKSELHITVVLVLLKLNQLQLLLQNTQLREKNNGKTGLKTTLML